MAGSTATAGCFVGANKRHATPAVLICRPLSSTGELLLASYGSNRGASWRVPRGTSWGHLVVPICAAHAAVVAAALTRYASHGQIWCQRTDLQQNFSGREESLHVLAQSSSPCKESEGEVEVSWSVGLGMQQVPWLYSRWRAITSNVCFEDCQLWGLCFEDCQLRGLSFEDCQLRGLRFGDCQFRGLPKSNPDLVRCEK